MGAPLNGTRSTRPGSSPTCATSSCAHRQANSWTTGPSTLSKAIREAYPEAYATALKLQAVLELRLGTPLTEDEVTYLTLHVARMVEDFRLR